MKKIESGKFKQWLKKLKDETGKTKIVARINRLMEGLPGDVAPVGHGVSDTDSLWTGVQGLFSSTGR